MGRSRELAELAASYDSGNLFGMKNRIINGAMMIDQRNAGASISNDTTGTQYSVDRWLLYGVQSYKFTAQQNAGSVTPPAGFTKYLGITSSSAYSAASGDYFVVAQYVEGFNTADLAWGTANAQTVTLSFWVRSSLTGTFGGSIANGSANRCYPFSYTISSANTWTNISVTIAGDTTGTWLTNNTSGVRVFFGLGAGATYSGTAGSWGSTFYSQTTGSTSVVGTNGATWYVTGVQLEKGSTATSFDYRPYGTELALCQRYYYKTYGQTVVPGTISNEGRIDQASTGGLNRPIVSVKFSPPMRIPPTVTFYSPSTGASGKCRNDNSGTDVTVGSYGAGETGVVWYPSATTTASDGFTVQLTASSEL